MKGIGQVKMRARDKGSSTQKLKIPRDLCEEIGSEKAIIGLMEAGLLSLKVVSLEREIADLRERTEVQEKKIAELPGEIERFQQLLEEAIKDRKILEELLGEKG
jgi:cell division protein FtsL